MMNENELVADGTMSITEARAFFGNASRSAVYQWMAEGSLPFIRLGRRRVIPRAAARRFAADRLDTGTRSRRIAR